MTEENLKEALFKQITDEWTRCRFIDPEAVLDDFVEGMKKKFGKRLGLNNTLCLMEEWKAKMKP